MSESQGMASLNDLLGSTTMGSSKGTSSWADAPVEQQHVVEEKPAPAAKKTAWGAVQAAPVASIKDLEMEEQSKSSKPAKVSTVADRDGGRGGASERPYAGSADRFGDRPSYNGGDRPSYNGGYNRESRGGFNRGYEGGGGSGGYNRGGYNRDGDEEGDYGRRGNGGYGDRPKFNPDMPSHGAPRGDRPPRAERPEVPFPESAPYILYLSGLPYEGTEDDVRHLLPEFWGPELAPRVKNVKVPIFENRLKHAFIEFEDADALREALTNDGREFMGRKVACLVAEPPKNSGGDRFGRGDRNRRTGGDDRRGGFGSGFAGSYNPDRPTHPRDREGGGFGDRPAPAERRPLNVAPRTVDTSASASSGSSASSKPNPFGAATASTKDIYADKPRAATPVAPVKPVETKSTQTSDRDSGDWRSAKDKKALPTKPAYRGGKPQGDQKQGAGRGGQRFADEEGAWKSTGGSAPSQPRAKPAPAQTASPQASADKGGNIFDNLADQ